MRYQWIDRPVLGDINPATVYEHTPLNPWKGEYPRFIRPIRNECRTERVKLYEDGTILKAGERKSA